MGVSSATKKIVFSKKIFWIFGFHHTNDIERERERERRRREKFKNMNSNDPLLNQHMVRCYLFKSNQPSQRDWRMRRGRCTSGTFQNAQNGRYSSTATATTTVSASVHEYWCPVVQRKIVWYLQDLMKASSDDSDNHPPVCFHHEYDDDGFCDKIWRQHLETDNSSTSIRPASPLLPPSIPEEEDPPSLPKNRSKSNIGFRILCRGLDWNRRSVASRDVRRRKLRRKDSIGGAIAAADTS